MPKKKLPARAKARLPMPRARKNPNIFLAETQQQVGSIQASDGYASAPLVQAAATSLVASANAFEALLSAIVVKRGELATLLLQRTNLWGDVVRDRQNLENSITTAAAGSPDAVLSFNCGVRTRTAAPDDAAPPTRLRLKNDPAMLGVVRARCDRVPGAASYVFAYTTQRDAPAGSGKLIVTTKASAVIADAAPGTTVYVRVAVVRPKSGQGTWSMPVEKLVR